MPDLHGSESGQALPLALIVLAVGVILVTVLILAVSVHVKLSSASASDLLDYYAADAGIERAVIPLTADPNAYPAGAAFSLALNNRTVSVAVAPLGSRVLPDPVGGMTTTVTSHLVTAQAGNITVKARSETRKVNGQPVATVHLTAWKVGQ
jgi:hypothetical protein